MAEDSLCPGLNRGRRNTQTEFVDGQNDLQPSIHPSIAFEQRMKPACQSLVDVTPARLHLGGKYIPMLGIINSDPLANGKPFTQYLDHRHSHSSMLKPC